MNELDVQKLQILSDQEQKFELGIDFEKTILSLMLRDKFFLIQSIGLIHPGYFATESKETICSILFDFYEQYKKLPTKKNVILEIEQRTKNKEEKRVWYLGELNEVYQCYDVSLESQEYYLDKLEAFAKEAALKVAFKKSVGYLQHNEWDKIDHELRQALLVKRNTSIGTSYFTELNERYELMKKKQKDQEIFITGFPGLDSAIDHGGLVKGSCGGFLGLSGSGKSFLLLNSAIENIKRGKKVLYVSLEMDVMQLSSRLDTMMLHNHPNMPGLIYPDDSGYKNFFVNQNQIHQAILENVEEFDDKKRLLIKHFPMGSLSVNDLRSYYTQVVGAGFQPDLLIIDYVGLLKQYSHMKLWDSKERIVEEIIALSQENGGQHATLLAFQANREGKKAIEESGVLDEGSLADSYGQARPMTTLWTISVSKIEKSLGVGRIFFAKNRMGKSGFWIYFRQDPVSLAYEQIEQEDYEKIRASYKQLKIEKTELKKDFVPNHG